MVGADKWKFSDDVLGLSANEFKSLVQKRFKGVKVKEANLIYNQLHGIDKGSEKRGEYSSEQGKAGVDVDVTGEEV